MKQLLKKCLVMVVMFTTIESYSNSITLQTNDQTKNVTAVSIDSVNEGSQFIIRDGEGVILYKEHIKETGTYSKRFDLTNLPDAGYYFEIDNQDEIKVIPFIVKNNVAEFIKDEEFKVVRPDVIVKDDRAYISKSSDKEQTWEIEVYYDEGYDLAHSEKMRDTKSLNRVYDFSNSKKGNYTIVFSSLGRTFSNSIHIP